MFAQDLRSKFLALFYFAIPIGSGLGFVVGGEMARTLGHWSWGLRLTPILGLVGIILILFIVVDPPRGESEYYEELKTSSYRDDLKSLAKKPSYILIVLATMLFTFCRGALGLFVLTVGQRALQTIPEAKRMLEVERIPLLFGIIVTISGVTGVSLGALLSMKLRPRFPYVDPLICGFGLIVSTSSLAPGIAILTVDFWGSFSLIAFGLFALNLQWSVAADMTLYVVIPTRRGTANAILNFVSHLIGDNISPYLIGFISDEIFKSLTNGVVPCTETQMESCVDALPYQFQSLKIALLINLITMGIGGLLFLVAAKYIVEDRKACAKEIRELEYQTPKTRSRSRSPSEGSTNSSEVITQGSWRTRSRSPAESSSSSYSTYSSSYFSSYSFSCQNEK